MARLIRIIICFNFKFLLLLQTSYAKCPIEVYTFSGSVISNNNTAIDKANVCIFLDNNESGAITDTSKSGEFQINYNYYRYKGASIFGDRCGEKPSSICVIVSKEGYFPKRLIFKIKELVVLGDMRIEIPVLILIPQNP